MRITSLNNKQNGTIHMILLIVVVLVIVGAIGAYIVTGGLKNTGKNSQSNSNTQSILPFASKTATTSTEIKTMMTDARNGNYDAKCTFTDDSGNASTIFITKDKMRINTTINKKAGHMLWFSDKAYIWADGDAKGSILPVTKGANDDAAQADKFASSVDKYKLSCQTVKHNDPNLFNVPSNITFTTFSTQSSSYSSSN